MADLLPQPYQFANNLSIQKCTISTAGLSEPIALQGKAIVAIIMPAAWTAAALQYYASYDNGTYYAVKDAATSVYLQTLVVADDWVVFPLADALFAPYAKLASVAAGAVTPVAQGAARQILLLVRNFLD